MLTYEDMIEYFKQKHLPSEIKLYNGKYGVGLVYMVEINDYGKIEPRLAIFNTISELENFIENFRFSDRIRTDSRELVNAFPTFYSQGKALTSQIVLIKKKKEEAEYIARKQYKEYVEQRAQTLLDKINQLSKEIKRLKSFIENQRKKTIKEKDYESLLNEKSSFDAYTFLPDKEVVPQRDICQLKITYNELLKEKAELERKAQILESFSKQNFFGKLLLSQKKINKALSDVSDNATTTIISIEELYVEEINFKKLLSKYERCPDVRCNAEYINTKLELYKQFDERPIDEPYEYFFQEAEGKLDSVAKKIGNEIITNKKQSYIPSDQEKQAEIFENLKKQYDENLTDEQKAALILYNSRFFELINSIISIPNYKAMSSMEILKRLKENQKFERFVLIIYNHCMTLHTNAFSGEMSNYLKSIFEKILPSELSRDILNMIGVDYYNNKVYYKHPLEYGVKDPQECIEYFDMLLCKLIDNLRNQIEIIKKIPETAIVLPENVIVFRGVNSAKKRSPEVPSSCSLMSTSTRPEVAAKYGGQQCYIYKINIKKGTPVRIMPYKVMQGLNNAYERFILEVSPSDSKGTKEILLDLDQMQEFVLSQAMEVAQHYSFEDGEFQDEGGGFIITGSIKPKNEQLVYDEGKNENKSL